MTQERYCLRCESEIKRPHSQNGNYVVGSDFTAREPREVVYGMRHTENTKQELDRLDEAFENRDRQALAAEAAHPDAPDVAECTNGTTVEEHSDGGEVETADVEEVPFSIPVDEFRIIEVENANVVQDDDEIALTYSIVTEREVQKTGLVCRDCVEDSDEIIWGPDGE